MRPWASLLVALLAAGCDSDQDLGNDGPDPVDVDPQTALRCTLPQAGWPIARGRADGSARGFAELGTLGGTAQPWAQPDVRVYQNTPIVAPDGLVLVHGTEPRNVEVGTPHLYALRPGPNGPELAWKSRDAAANLVPTVCEGQKALVAQGSSVLVVSLATGAVLHKVDTGHSLSSPVVPAGDLLVVESPDGVVALRQDGSVAWFRALAGANSGVPTLRPDGSVLVSVRPDLFGSERNVHALDPADGHSLWVSPRTESGGRGHVLALDDGGALIGDVHSLIKLDAGGAEVWRWTNGAEGPRDFIEAPSVAADGSLWVTIQSQPAVALSVAGAKLWETVQYSDLNGFAHGTDGKALSGSDDGALLVGAGGAVTSLSESAGFRSPSFTSGAAFGVSDDGALVMIR